MLKENESCFVGALVYTEATVNQLRREKPLIACSLGFNSAFALVGKLMLAT